MVGQVAQCLAGISRFQWLGAVAGAASLRAQPAPRRSEAACLRAWRVTYRRAPLRRHLWLQQQQQQQWLRRWWRWSAVA
eukprot:3901601-Alexandrium_andersonii.AAC.1